MRGNHRSAGPGRNSASYHSNQGNRDGVSNYHGNVAGVSRYHGNKGGGNRYYGNRGGVSGYYGNGGFVSRYHGNRGGTISFPNSDQGKRSFLQQLGSSANPNSSSSFHGNRAASNPTQAETAAAAYADFNSNRIWQLFVEKRQTDATYAKKLLLRDTLQSIVSPTFQSAGIFIVGSSLNGFGTNSTDLDLCLMLTSQELHQKREAAAVLTMMLKPLRQCRFLNSVQLIHAKVPIIKFRDTVSQLDCDLNINNPIGIYNTHLMAAYAKCDWRVRPLVMFVKLWAQSLGVQDASQGRLSSYSLALMTVQYLQAGCSPPVLYSLQSLYPQVFDYNRPYAEIDMRVQLPWEELRSQNCQNLGQLFAGFVQYYSEFDWRGFSVSVRLGKPLPIQLAYRLVPAQELQGAMKFKIYIEEPFSLTNAARSVHRDEVFAQIQRAFRVTAQSLRNQRSLSDILNNPV